MLIHQYLYQPKKMFLLFLVCIFVILIIMVNTTLFVKLLTHPTLISIFNISHSLHFLLICLLSPALMTTYYMLITFCKKIENNSMENLDQEYHSRTTMRSLFFTLRINLIIYGINFSFFNILYRYLYVKYADTGLRE